MNRRIISLVVFAAAVAPSLTLSAESVDLAAAAKRVQQIVAHRGASVERPECTLSAIRRAIEVGATAVEVDVRTSRDGQLFILHDATLDRTTNGKGKANALTLQELQQLDAGSWFDPQYKDERIPSLIETARACKGKIDILLDLKEQGDDYDQKVVRIIREHGDPAKTIVGVRSVAQAKRFRKLLPQARQLALIPSVETIEDFAKAGADVIRLWPRWLKSNPDAVGRVRTTGKGLHLNGSTGEIAEVRVLLVHRPESLSSDDPRKLKETLKRIAAGDVPIKKLSALIEKAEGTRLEVSEAAVGSRSFLNRDYKMLELPNELHGKPHYLFDGGAGDRIVLRFREPTVLFAAFEYNNSGNWSFSDGQDPKENGWHLWKAKGYRGTSNGIIGDKLHHASIWFREFKAGQELRDMPRWWLCLGVVGLDDARKIAGFKAGLVTETKPPIRRYSHLDQAAKSRALHIPQFESVAEIEQWQKMKRIEFNKRLLYPYQGKLEFNEGKTEDFESYRQQEVHVSIDGERLFRYFRLTPRRPTDGPLPAIVCFMGHGKVSQILKDQESYQHACAKNFAKAGYLVYAMENIGMEPGRDTHHDLDRVLRLEGVGWYHLLFAHQRILLDKVFADPRVDTKRVGTTGISTGGLLALSAAVMEPRVVAASVQGIFGSMRVSFIQDRNRHCSCGAILGLLPDFDLPEMALLVAPRPLHISNGERDGFSPKEAERCLKLISPVYQQSGGAAPEFSVPPGGHAFSFEPALAFFRKSMK